MDERLKLAVFDVDGTLVDSLGVIARAVGLCFIKNELDAPPTEQVRAGIGLSLEEAIERLVPEDIRTYSLCAQLVDDFRHVMLDMRANGNDEHQLYDGIIEVLDILEERGWLLAVATGNSQKGLATVYARHNLQKYFLANRTADICPGKPAPAMLHELMDELGADSGRTVIIGDSVYDMLMGVNAKTARLGVTWGYCDTGLLVQSGAEAVIDKVEDIPDALDKLIQP